MIDKLVRESQVKALTDVTIEAINALSAEVKTVASGIQGTIKPNSATPTEQGMYVCEAIGTYINFGNIEISETDFTSGIVYIVFSIPNIFKKYIVPISANGEVKEGDFRAVSGDEVAKEFYLNSETGLLYSKIDFGGKNLFLIENVINGSYISSSGTLTPLPGTSCGFVIFSDNTENSLTLFCQSHGGNSRRAVFVDVDEKIIGDPINTGVVNRFVFNIPATAVKLFFTIDAPNAISKVDISTIKAFYGDIANDDDERKVKKIDGAPIVASEILSTELTRNFVKENGHIEVKDVIYNIVDPVLIHANSTYNNGVYSSSSVYHASGKLEVNPTSTYYASTKNGISLPIRSWRELDATGNQIFSQAAGSYKIIKPSNPNTKSIVVIFYNSIPTDGLCLADKDNGFIPFKGYEKSFQLKSPQIILDPKSVVTQENLEKAFEGMETGYKIIITLKNSDKVLWSGSSSIEVFYSPTMKAWLNKLQDYLDIQIVPYGFSGHGANEIALKFQNDTPTAVANGVKPSEINPTYVFIGQPLNSKDLLPLPNDTEWIASNENLLRSAIAITGGKPIIGTAYRTESRPWIENSLKKLADKWGADFIPIGTYHSSFIRTNPLKYLGFFGEDHPAIRTSEAYTLPILSYLTQLPRTKQGILLFEARNQESLIAELNYKDNSKRAEKFRSIQVGEMSLNAEDEPFYDRLDEARYATRKTNTSEYMKLFRKQPVNFRKKLLIEFIIPKVRTEKVKLNVIGQNISEYYIFNTLTQVFEKVTSLEILDRKYIEFDKIKLLCEGENIIVSDVSVEVFGGVDKPLQAQDRILPVTAGKTIVESEGFTATSISNWNKRANVVHNITEKYGDAKFNDMPMYLGESKNIVTLTDILSRSFTLENINTFGYRTLRVWTCSRLNPKIYNPIAFAGWEGENNPYTNISWYGKDKYDYDDLNIVIRDLSNVNHNTCKSINIQKVGLFWNLGYVDVIMPLTQNGNYDVLIQRGSQFNPDYPMEICDVKIELI